MDFLIQVNELTQLLPSGATVFASAACWGPFLHDNHHLAIANSLGGIQFFKVSNGKDAAIFGGLSTSERVTQMAWVGSLLCVATTSGKVELHQFDLTTGKVLSSIDIWSEADYALCTSIVIHDSQIIFAKAENVILYNVMTAALEKRALPKLTSVCRIFVDKELRMMRVYTVDGGLFNAHMNYNAECNILGEFTDLTLCLIADLEEDQTAVDEDGNMLDEQSDSKLFSLFGCATSKHGLYDAVLFIPRVDAHLPYYLEVSTFTTFKIRPTWAHSTEALLLRFSSILNDAVSHCQFDTMLATLWDITQAILKQPDGSLDKLADILRTEYVIDPAQISNVANGQAGILSDRCRFALTALNFLLESTKVLSL